MQNETSVELFRTNIALIRRMARLVGADVLQDNYRPNLRTYRTMLFIALYFVFLIYTLWFHTSGFLQILKTLAPVGMGIQGLYKLYNVLANRNFFIERGVYLELFHEENKHHSRSQLLTERMRQTYTLNKLLLVAYFMAVAGYGMYPFYYYIVYRERMLAINVLVPGIDSESVVGFFATVVFQFSLLTTALIGIAAADSALLFYMANLTVLVEVYKGSLQDMNDLLEASKPDLKAIRKRTKEIFAEHYEVISYQVELEKGYFGLNFIQITTSVACLAMILFLCYMDNYIPGYGFLIGAFFQLLEFCLLGTIFTVQNEDMVLSIYDVKWYLLPKEEKRMWNFMLHKSQNAVNMTIGGLAILNVETFVVVRRITEKRLKRTRNKGEAIIMKICVTYDKESMTSGIINNPYITPLWRRQVVC
ncbi:odorant receptor 67d-like [Uranotaenia lowii]|uniref:odorant receptor 67d-like n=1 Tax=Uranotaenia lowii TaxID=190385 RepID=UPI002478CF26|nr:odorant receptor 67d-like [Uranotaenia lowii]